MVDTKWKRVIIIVLLLLFIALCIRQRFGFDPTDESYYYALAKRFCQGDRPFIDEWYPSQLFAILLSPFYFVYTLFVPSAEGIILAGRYAYLLIQAVVSVYLFKSFEHKRCNYLLVILYLMCSRQNIPGLSYYNLYLTFCLVAVVAVYNALIKGRPAAMVLAGICVSGATLCMPYFGVVVVAFGIALLLKRRYKELFFMAGSVLCCLALYIAFLLSRGALTEYITALKYVLSNPDYADTSVMRKLLKTLLSIGKVTFMAFPGVIYLLVQLVSMKRKTDPSEIITFDKKDYCVMAVSLLLCILSFGVRKPGAIYIQLTFLSLPVICQKMINAKRTKVKNDDGFLGIIFYVIGLILSLAFWIGSDTGACCLTLGFIVSLIGTALVVFSDETLGVYRKDKKFNYAYVGILVCVILSLSFARLLGPCYRDGNLHELDAVITRGPAKGLYTQEGYATDYDKVMDIVTTLNTDSKFKSEGNNSKILFTRFMPVAYVACNLRNADMTTWRTALTDERLSLYYKVNPQQFPQVVVIFNEDIGEIKGISGGGYMNKDNPLEGELWNEIKNWQSIKMEAGTIYF